MADRVAARHERGARRRAHRHAIERLAAHAGGGKLVDVRRPDLAAAVAKVGIAEVVGHDEDDVGLVGTVGRGGAEQERTECTKDVSNSR